MRALTRCLIAAGLVTPALSLMAQAPAPLKQPESIPYELAAQLMGAGGLSSESQILVGSMPEWVTNRVVSPPNARVVGSAFLGSTVVVVFAFGFLCASAFTLGDD